MKVINDNEKKIIYSMEILTLIAIVGIFISLYLVILALLVICLIMVSSDIARRRGYVEWMVRTEYLENGKKRTHISEYIQLVFAGAFIVAIICLLISSYVSV